MNLQPRNGIRTPSFRRDPAAPVAGISIEELENFSLQIIDHSIEQSTRAGYQTAIRAWTAFTSLFDLPLLPSERSLVLFISYTIRRIASVDKYLSALAHYFKLRMRNWNEIRNAEVVKRALIGSIKWRGHQVHRVDQVLAHHLKTFIDRAKTGTFDDLLFATLSTVGFFALHRLGELVDPDNPSERDSRKTIKRGSATISKDLFSYHLPYHKTDPFFKGTPVVILAECTTSDFSSNLLFAAYLRCRDQRHPTATNLFLREDGSTPTRTWYLTRLKAFLGPGFGGHSLRPGGATWYALGGSSSEVIRRLGRWAPNSTTWEQYIRAHPSLFIAFQRST